MTRSRRLLALVAATALLIGGTNAGAGAQTVDGDPGGQAPAVDADQPPPPVRPFLDVPGVDLARLGHTGTEIDAAIVERMAEPLPSEAADRVAEILLRLDLAPPQLESLIEAEAVLGQAVTSLDRSTERAQAAVEVDARRAAAAERRLTEAQGRLVDRVDALAEHRLDMAEVAVAAYVRPPDADVLAKVLGGAVTTSEDLTAEVLFTAKADYDGAVRDSLDVSRALAVEQVRRDEDDAALVAERATRSADALAGVQQRRDAHRAAFEQVSTARTLLDQQLPTLREDLDRTIEEAWGDLELLAGIGVTDVPVVDVEGIRVHVAIAPRLQALLDAARADGIDLRGWGYRTTEQQIALRRSNCGPLPEDVYLKPAEACSPPTARPGSSMHERGLAVDFNFAGRSISSQDSPAYQWLAANAQVFGFQNLPSEPWHWSTNGQ